MDAGELGRLTIAAWRREKVSMVRVAHPPAFGDSTSSGEGITNAEGDRRDTGRGERSSRAKGWRWVEMARQG